MPDPDEDLDRRDEAARREAEARRREQERLERELARAEAQARTQAERDRRQAEKVARQAEKEAEARRREQDRQVAEAEKEAARARREADRAAADAALAERRAALRLETARARAARAGLAPEPTDDDLPPGFAALWRPDPPAEGRRGPRPGLSVAEIVDAAVRLADREGAAAVSMARVADEVGVTTMALYRYVGGKDELVAAMYDAAIGAPPEQEPGTPWRTALEAWCRAQLEGGVRHPWLGAAVPPAALGPNRVAWIEAGLRAVEGTGLSPAARAAVVGRLSLHLLGEMQLIAATTAREGVEHPATLDYAAVLARFTDAGTHPAIAEALATGAFDEDPAEDMQGFGLTLLLDGVEALVARAGGPA